MPRLARASDMTGRKMGVVGGNEAREATRLLRRGLKGVKCTMHRPISLDEMKNLRFVQANDCSRYQDPRPCDTSVSRV